ncbi:hypothetical protein LR013_03925 [candidate division NPL-UPA2 bacterium]|nr:hypothetical protein [candidate division NPL-UPA2 bacterium]
MYNISIYFASGDKSYLESVEKYTLNNCKHLNITFFSNASRLGETLKNSTARVDIVLVDEEIYADFLEKEEAEILVVLVEDENTVMESDLRRISKYQSGEKLVAHIQDIYKEANSGKFFELTAAEGSTKIIGVYSPIGGAGKTTVATMSSIISSHLGKRVFYLNLENIASTNAYFKSDNDESISKLIYFLRNKDKETVQQKMATLWSLDSKYGVYFFAPPDNISDINELSINEIDKLFTVLKACAYYDYVFVDFSAVLDNDKKAILRRCDQLFMLIGHDESSAAKIDLFSRDLETMPDKEMLLAKMTMILNKYDDRYKLAVEQSRVGGREINFKLPYEASLLYCNYHEFQVNTNNNFQAAIANLVNTI